MTTVGQIERKTQDRVVALFRDTLGYTYLGDWHDRDHNCNIEPALLRAWLKKQKHEATLIEKALRELEGPPTTPARPSTTATAPSTNCCATG